MKTIFIVKNEKSGEVYFENTTPEEIIAKVLKNNAANNCIRVGYIFEIDGKKLKIDSISLNEILKEEVNGFNAVLTAYVTVQR